jgi:hydroxymethylpyrimidine/phosphomethylpyrimidine kinase
VKVVLTIAGSDSGGGAGIQADLKTFEAHGLFGATAITSITAQNTVEVRRTFALPADILRSQIEAVFDDLPVAAVKIGMLSNADLVEVVADTLHRYASTLPIVLDPVIMSSSGTLLLQQESIEALRSRLIPLTTLLTPNISEAALLSGGSVDSETEMISAAVAIQRSGARTVLVKGGDLDPSESETGWSDDIFFDGRTVYRFRAPRIGTTGRHGTGCTLSSAIAANLATGANLIDAIRRAKDYVHSAILHSPAIGKGNSPLRHQL